MKPDLLGRIPSPPDQRDLRVTDVEPWLAARVVPRAKRWSSVRVLNQGETNHCVGFGCAAWGIAAPITTPWHDDDGHRLYYAAKVHDGDPEGEMGSCVRSGLKALQERGHVDKYFWLTAVGEEPEMGDLLTFLLCHGTVIVGTTWTTGMFYPDANGRIRPTGRSAGGHCYLLRGYDRETRLVRLRNSWGRGWGKLGDAFIHRRDLKRLLDGDGEACAIIERKTTGRAQ